MSGRLLLAAASLSFAGDAEAAPVQRNMVVSAVVVAPCQVDVRAIRCATGTTYSMTVTKRTKTPAPPMLSERPEDDVSWTVVEIVF